MNFEYEAYLHSAQWQKIRSERLRVDNFKCQKCGRPFDLQVHHLIYDRIGHEDINDLITLCKNCHAQIEKTKKEYASSTKKMDEHYKNVRRFIREYTPRDLSNTGYGDLDLCSLKVVKRELARFLRPYGDNILNGASVIISFFAKKRWRIILRYIDKSYPANICYNQTLFSKQMIQKVYSDPEKYREILKQED